MNQTEITFQQLGVAEHILAALEKKGFTHPTRVQRESIPPLQQWKDVMVKAPTGTGKTFAFGIPMIEHINQEQEAVQGLILAPTRELAHADRRRAAGPAHLHGGRPRGRALRRSQDRSPSSRQLQRKPQIVVATPGRLMDHYKRRTIRFDKIKTVILDEADRMLDMGFYDDVTRIIEKVKNRKNLGLFSATMSQEVMTVSWMYQRDEVEITVPADEENKPDIAQFSISCSPFEKEEVTKRLLDRFDGERIIIFCNTKHMCQRLADDLARLGIRAGCLHGDIRQKQREKTMDEFRHGQVQILIATDVASRGIDVDDVGCVINYDIPEENEYYIHRIGRTGRAKKAGAAYSILGTFPEQAKLDEIAKYAHFQIKPMRFDEAGELVEKEIRKPVPRRKYR